ncbi:hypothetical protein AC579_8225 [Pseudocercospora musae]|uniref:Uncharacterized protein n=1 Tax=Pseudocercospora musae TaxID=113226 RepID=A0A139IVR0_9PEZI|nr:hypothetical protein AC579_8225 [Pseudocercospora musae]KXT18804.1 hypothetical protein AC579_8225 [Pseudocercospora musae]
MTALNNLKTIPWDIGNGATYREQPRESKGRVIPLEAVNEKPGLKRSLSSSLKKKCMLWKKEDKIETEDDQLTSMVTNVTQASSSKEKGKATLVDNVSHA